MYVPFFLNLSSTHPVSYRKFPLAMLHMIVYIFAIILKYYFSPADTFMAYVMYHVTAKYPLGKLQK